MEFVRKLVHAETPEDLRKLISDERKDTTTKILKYPNVLMQIKGMKDSEKEWAMAYRSVLCMCGKHTNNYSEDFKR